MFFCYQAAEHLNLCTFIPITLKSIILSFWSTYQWTQFSKSIDSIKRCYFVVRQFNVFMVFFPRFSLIIYYLCASWCVIPPTLCYIIGLNWFGCPSGNRAELLCDLKKTSCLPRSSFRVAFCINVVGTFLLSWKSACEGRTSHLHLVAASVWKFFIFIYLY